MSTVILRRVLALLLASAATAQITPGHLIVARAGDGMFGLTNSACHLFLDEYDAATPAQAAPLQSLAMPMTIAGNAMHGFVTQSVDGRYLAIGGYAAPPYTGLIAFNTAVAAPRVITRVALTGAIDATTVLNDTLSGGGGLAGNIVSVATIDGTAFWASGDGAQIANRGICYATLGASSSIQVASVPNATRVADIFAGQLFATTLWVPLIGVDSIGTGVPTTPGQTGTMLNGMPSTDGSVQPWDFWFADASTLYVADARTNGAGGIQKWTKVGTTWTLQYTLPPAANVGCRAVSGMRDLTGTRLFATTSPITGNQLLTLTDTGPASTFTMLATAANNTGLRGVRFVRQPYDITTAGTACSTTAGIPTIGTAGGPPVAGNAAFGLTIGNAPPFAAYITVVSIGAFIGPGVPLSLVGGPPCALLYTPSLDILLSGLTNGVGIGVTPLSLAPADSALWGLDLPVQHLILDPVTYGAFALPFATTRALQIEIGN